MSNFIDMDTVPFAVIINRTRREWRQVVRWISALYSAVRGTFTLLLLLVAVCHVFWRWSPTAQRQTTFNALVTVVDERHGPNMYMVGKHLQHSKLSDANKYNAEMLAAWNNLIDRYDRHFGAATKCVDDGRCEIGWKTASQCRRLTLEATEFAEEHSRWKRLCPGRTCALPTSASAERVFSDCSKWLEQNPKRAKVTPFMAMITLLFGPTDA